MPTPKNDKRITKRKNKRRVAPAGLQRRRRALGGKKKNFLIIEMVDQPGGDVSTIVYTIHDGALRGTATRIHSKYRRYIHSLFQRTHASHARAHARAKESIERIIRGRGPSGRVRDLFLLQAAEKIDREERRRMLE